MNRFYLFNTWVFLFFIVLTGLFILTSCFYMIQFYLLSRNKRYNQTLYTSDVRKRNYKQNLKLAAKIEANEVLASVNSKQKDQSKSKSIKKEIKDSNAKKKSFSRLRNLFKIIKKNGTKCNSFSENGYLSQSKNYYGDQLDGQTQSYESFETMTTDSECYRDWRHSIDFSNGIISLNNYHDNRIMQKAYERLYARYQSTTTLNRSRGDISIPVNDLYPVSVVPYDFETLHLYDCQRQNKFFDDFDSSKYVNDDKKSQHLEDTLIDQDLKENGQRYTNQNLSQTELPNFKNKCHETENSFNTFVSTQCDEKIKKQLTTSVQQNNLDGNMNLLSHR